jgi:hypothetical protein
MKEEMEIDVTFAAEMSSVEVLPAQVENDCPMVKYRIIGSSLHSRQTWLQDRV